MMILIREEAITFASFFQMFDLSEKERLLQVQNVLSEAGLEEAKDPEVNLLLRKYLEEKLALYTNDYLQSYLSERADIAISVLGVGINLYPCPCCGFKTLKEKGEYFICAVCFWEDDGTVDMNTLSVVNRMTLAEARANFEKYGVISENLIGKLDHERTKKYSLM